MGKVMAFLEGIYLAIKVWIRTTQWMRVAKIAICSAVTVLLIFLMAAMLFAETGSFTVKFIPSDSESGVAISLSETESFEDPTVMLNADGAVNMTNISGHWLPAGLDSVDGSHNGENYIAYTFYAKNTGSEACVLKEEFKIESAVKGADAAIRVRIYKNGRETTYAKMSAEGIPEYGTTPFVSDTVAYSGTTERFETEQINKYTLVIWLEGDDPECLDNIKGGNVKMSMNFTVEEIPKE